MTEYEQQADELEERSQKLGEEIADVREDWERKKADDSVPGAQAPETEQADESAEDEREPWPDE
jgi:hypothetical protein